MKNIEYEEYEKVIDCYISKDKSHMEYRIIEISKRKNLTKYVHTDINGNTYELEIDITKLQKSKVKLFQKLTKGAEIEKRI